MALAIADCLGEELGTGRARGPFLRRDVMPEFIGSSNRIGGINRVKTRCV